MNGAHRFAGCAQAVTKVKHVGRHCKGALDAIRAAGFKWRPWRARMIAWRAFEVVKINERSRAPLGFRATIGIFICAGALAPTWPCGGSAMASSAGRRALQISLPMRLAQLGSSGDETEVSPVDVEKYINVYKAMQKNHSLTVEQAASQQGLTVQGFRTLESRIERDDALRERVRKALRAPAEASPTPAK
jgi:hypothetical protein